MKTMPQRYTLAVRKSFALGQPWLHE